MRMYNEYCTSNVHCAHWCSDSSLWHAVWLENPQLYFANYLDADVLASTDSVAPTRDDGGLENPDVIGRYDLNVGMSSMSVLLCTMGKSAANCRTLAT